MPQTSDDNVQDSVVTATNIAQKISFSNLILLLRELVEKANNHLDSDLFILPDNVSAIAKVFGIYGQFETIAAKFVNEVLLKTFQSTPRPVFSSGFKMVYFVVFSCGSHSLYSMLLCGAYYV